MRNNKWLLIPLILVLTAGVAGAWVYTTRTSGSEAAGDIAANETVAPEVVPDVQAVANENAPEAPAAAQPNVSVNDIYIVADGSTPSGPRSIGSIDAPVTMIDFSSLTCPHCASAHQNILPGLIKNYVETGKLRIVFSDFPLNKEALDGSKVSRCVANDQYFKFLTLLFNDIEAWAYTGQHPDALITNATLTGLSAERARECLNDTALEESILKAAKEAADKYQVNATPTFVFNDGRKTLSGARPYGEFTNAIDDLLAEKK